MGRPVLHAAGICETGLLAAMHERCFRPSGGEVWDEASIAGLLDTPGTFAVIAEDRETGPAGLLIGRNAGPEAEILTIGVLPETRRAGHGRILIEEAARLAVAGRASALFLEVAADNTAALALYEGCGFSSVGRRRNYYRRESGPVDAVILRRSLRADA